MIYRVAFLCTVEVEAGEKACQGLVARMPGSHVRASMGCPSRRPSEPEDGVDQDTSPTADDRVEDPEAPGIPLRIVGFERTSPVYANEVHVSADPMALQLVFTQLLPPPIATVSDQQRIAEQGFLPVEVVARVVLAPAAVERLIDLLQDRLGYQREQASEYEAWLRRESASATEKEAADGVRGFGSNDATL